MINSSTTPPMSDDAHPEPFSQYVPLMNSSISSIFKTALSLSLHNPRMARTLLRLARASRSAARRRDDLARSGLVVPPVLILSVTHRCNLRCKGCYAASHSWGESDEMGIDAIDNMLSQAEDLGISFCILAGGEPLTRPQVLGTAARHPSIIFPLFTNGMLLTDEIIGCLADNRHIVPIISIEGGRCETDRRRGEGAHAAALSAMGALERADVPFGVSITVDTNNIGTICDDALIADLYGRGARIFYFIEYVAMDESTAHQELSLEGRRRLLAFIGRAKKAHTGIYIAFPGNEEAYGGCLSSGRGFVHINPSGGLEPCPAAPFTDINVTNTSLREALASPMLAAIREHHELLDESQGGCALWRNRHKVRALLDATTKYSCTGRE